MDDCFDCLHHYEEHIFYHHLDKAHEKPRKRNGELFLSSICHLSELLQLDNHLYLGFDASACFCGQLFLRNQLRSNWENLEFALSASGYG